MLTEMFLPNATSTPLGVSLTFKATALLGWQSINYILNVLLVTVNFTS